MKPSSLIRCASLAFISLGACTIETNTTLPDAGANPQAGSGGNAPQAGAGGKAPQAGAGGKASQAGAGGKASQAGSGGSAQDAGTVPPTIPTIPEVASGGDCPAPAGPGTTHDSYIVDTETWTAAAGPHYIENSISVKGTLTIEACAQVILSKGVSIDVGSSSDAGRLITNGLYTEATADKPEVFQPVTFSSTADDEFWGMVFVSGLGEAELNATVFDHGGNLNYLSTSHGGTLVARGPNDGTLKRMIAANLVFVLESASFGVTLESGAGFKEGPSSQLYVLGTGRSPKPAGYNGSIEPIYPAFVEPPGIGTLPPGNYYGSTDTDFAANDKILVVPFRALAGDEQFHDRGVPYLIRGDFYMRPTTTSTLKIEPGVQLRFFRETASSTRYSMQLGDGASIDPRPVSIDIRGTEEKPIIFTSDAETPMAGDWVGLVLDCSPTTGNHFEYAAVLYAGAPSGTNSYGCGPKANDAAILITDWRPDNAFITNVAISTSAGSGIMSGWSSDSDGPNLKTGNIFEEMGNGCAVTRWSNATGLACPDRTDEAPLCL